MRKLNRVEKTASVNSYIMLFIIAMALVIEMAILSVVNQRSANRTTELLMNQVVSILEDNDRSEEELIDSLKEEYITRAQTVAFILASKPAYETNINALKRIAIMMDIDEINLFDDQGVIYSGTNEEYFGYSFDSGEQISYFKPMLENKLLTMCQDITPNTAVGREMMYAITWSDGGDMMVQVGVQPKHLIEELKAHDVANVVKNMPAYEGISVYITEPETGMIFGATDSDTVGKTLEDVGLPNRAMALYQTSVFSRTLKGYQHFCRYYKTDRYTIVIASSSEPSVASFLACIGVLFIYLMIAGHIVIFVVNKAMQADEAKNDQLAILTSMAGIYYSMHMIDLETNSVTEYTSGEKGNEIIEHVLSAEEVLHRMTDKMIQAKDLTEAWDFMNLRTISDRLRGKKIITHEFESLRLGWFRISFISIDKNEDGTPKRLILVTRIIEEEKRREATLIQRSNTDELTGFYNRRAYEENIEEHNDTVTEENFVYVSMDVNGLKNTNDTLGHAAGDELLLGAASCMRKCLSPYGPVYRIGGDEFVALLFVDEDQLSKIQKELEETTAKWRGNMVASLSIACGYVIAQNEETKSVREIAKLADKLMYEKKSAFYSRNGMDRRGQNNAGTAMKLLYDEVIVINLTKDCYRVLKWAKEEPVSTEICYGLSQEIAFYATSGAIHSDDIVNYMNNMGPAYLKGYFLAGNEVKRLFYRKKIGDVYHRMLIEITKASNYEDNNQSLYLYVKDIEE